jgi:hypothetical protein
VSAPIWVVEVGGVLLAACQDRDQAAGEAAIAWAVRREYLETLTVRKIAAVAGDCAASLRALADHLDGRQVVWSPQRYDGPICLDGILPPESRRHGIGIRLNWRTEDRE